MPGDASTGPGPSVALDGAAYDRAVRGQGWRRWLLPVSLVLLVLWVAAVVVTFEVFGGPTSPIQWLSIVVTFLALALVVAGELMARRERR